MPRYDAEEALQQLKSGNWRYVEGRVAHPNQTVARRQELVEGQEPFAVVIGCSDSRVPPEIIFDCGLGDLFVIRVAGNVVDDLALGSVEYGVEKLGARLVLVLGHTRCGAVAATVQGGHTSGHIGSLVVAIRPAFVQAQGEPGDVADNTVRANVRRVVERVRVALEIGGQGSGLAAVRVAGGVYHLDTGMVELL